jgi:hypothetical protein
VFLHPGISPNLLPSPTRVLFSSHGQRIRLNTTTALGTPRKPSPLDLFKAKNLKTIDLWSEFPDFKWITDTLRSAELKTNLLQVKITVSPPINVDDPAGEMMQRELEDPDYLLVKLWASHRVLLQVRCGREGGRSLLPEVTSKEGVRVLRG